MTILKNAYKINLKIYKCIKVIELNNLSMEISKTQNYQYQLSKDIHQRNVINSKPAVRDQIQPATARTIQLTHSRPHNRDIPYLQQYELQFSNKNITHRLIDIFDSNHSPLQSESSYARYNNFERPFRSKNPNRDRKNREIQLQNQKIYKKISTMRPRIGSFPQWKQQHQKASSYSKIKSRYQSASKQDNSQHSLYESNLPEALQELQASLRQIRNSGKGRGGLGVDSSGIRVEIGLPQLQKRSRGKYYDMQLNY